MKTNRLWSAMRTRFEAFTRRTSRALSWGMSIAALVLAAPNSIGQTIGIRVSYKIVLDPATGLPPTGVTANKINQIVDHMNDMLASYGRGYRIAQVGTAVTVGGLGEFGRPSPSHYYSADFHDENHGGQFANDMESDAMDHPGLYAWDEHAINVYVTNGICGGRCSFPASGEIVVIGTCSANEGSAQEAEVHLHEFGHYFNLFHTQGRYCGDECTSPGDDHVSDTLEDLHNWGTQDIAQWNFSTPYLSLTATQRAQVDDVHENVMSYHLLGRSRLTEGQLERWTNAANNFRSYVTTGETLRVGAGHLSLGDAVSNADPNGGDVLLLYPGSFSESLIISKPVALLATRQGPAIIGDS